ncbi:MFS transporter [Ostreiculturibacter nitratireducens]|uniref:MFS transporter n=1 Tax=Ostreiculturibacter nitratireducens TaxID=3075226 RepID=UPI0031B58173
MNWSEEAFALLADAEEEAGDLQPEAREAEAGNFLRHAASLAATKVADGLIDPKLVLAWLLTHLGSPAFLVGLLVPIREAGALLPQLVTAARIRSLPRRKWVWAGASLVQGLAAAAIGLSAISLDGAAAGIAVTLALAALALARSAASVSYKDVLGKTVGKSRRGAATGLASSAASAAVLVFALALILRPEARFALVLAALVVASILWLAASALFATLREPAQPGQRSGALAQLGLLREDAQLRRFIAARGLLVATALAPPYLVLLGAGDTALETLGALVLASALASLLSSYVWGRLADRSSRLVLIRAGLLAALPLALAPVLPAVGLLDTPWALPLSLFVLMIAYHGVRQGRSTYLVDTAPPEARAAYAALANTAIGILLLAAGVFGALASSFGAGVTLGLFAVMSVAGAWVARGLAEAEA